jgi:signal peptidase II
MLFAGVLFFDQLFKNQLLRAGDIAKNQGALFGWHPDTLFCVLTLILFLFFAVHALLWKKQMRIAIPIALILSGITSNTIDRISYGFVIDYLHFSDIFIFNLADLAILAGTSIFIWQIIRK